MILSLNEFLLSISFALDLAEKEIACASEKHSKRVAYIAIQIAKALGLDEKEQFDLCSYALLHDNGIIENYVTYLDEFDRNDKDIEEFLKVENFKNHCIIGEKNIQKFPFLSSHKNVILYHHENYDGSGFFGKKGNEISILSQIINFADRLDTTFDLTSITYERKCAIDNFVEENKHLYCPEIYEAYKKLSNSFFFWGDLEYFNDSYLLENLIPKIDIDISLEEILEITNVFSRIIDAKSKFTAKHSFDLEEKVLKLVNYFNLDEDTKLKIRIAANLHDIGKLGTPRNILDKEGKLTEKEFFEIRKHAYLTHNILSRIKGFDEINKLASSHHEKPDGSGYPFGLTFNELGFEERIVSCLDFYQALIEHRPYRKGMNHISAINIIKDTLKDFQIDNEIIKAIDTVFGN